MDSEYETYFKKLSQIKVPEKKGGQTDEAYKRLCELYSKVIDLSKDALTGESAKRKISRLLQRAGRQQLIPLDRKGLPIEEGRYFVESRALGLMEIDVYEHPVKGLSCFCDDFGSSGTEGVDDSTDCHVSVQNTGLEFIIKVGELNHALD